MLINDHINLSGINPLVGIRSLSFTNMTDCYAKEYRDKIKEIAKSKNIDLKEGIFCQLSGPSYETQAEIKRLRLVGVDSISMSTAHDCIIANYFGMKVVGISVIVNTFGEVAEELSHQEVLENASRASKNLKELLETFVSSL